MKAKTVILFIAGGLLVIGIILCFIAFAISDFKISGILTRGPFIEKTFTVSANNITSVYIEDSNKKVTIIPSDDEQIHVLYSEDEKEIYKIQNDGGKLSIVLKNNRRWYEYIGVLSWNFDSNPLTVKIPASYAGSIDCTTSNGDVTVSDFTALDILNVSTSNAGIALSEINVKQTILHTSNGKIKADNLQAESFSSETSNASVELSNIRKAQSISCKTSNGRITVKQASGHNIFLKTSNSNIEIGQIEVGNEITCNTSNGNIKGNVSGNMNDFSITSRTSNGDNNLPKSSTGGNKIMKIHTSNANIEINFIPVSIPSMS